MKKMLIAFLFAPMLIAATIATTDDHNEDNPSPSLYKMMEVTYLWELCKQGYAPIRERDDTWLFEGFRSKYAMMKKYVSLDLVEAAFGVPVFTKGPHKGDMNFNSMTEFGHYNPAFLAEVKANLQTILDDPTYGNIARRIFNRNLKDMAHIYHDTYRYMKANRAKQMSMLKRKYQGMISAPGGTVDGSMWMEFTDYDIQNFDIQSDADAKAKAKRYNDYDAGTAGAFWIRRSIDGTADQIFEILDMMIQASSRRGKAQIEKGQRMMPSQKRKN